MKNLKISNGEFNYRPYVDISMVLENTKADYSKDISVLNESDSNYTEINNFIEATNTLLNNPELAAKYDALLVSNQIDSFVASISSKLKASSSGYLRNINMAEVLNDGKVHEIIEQMGYDRDDFYKLAIDKTSFELLEILYNMAGYQFPKQKIDETGNYRMTGAMTCVDFLEHDCEGMIPTDIDDHNKSL